MSLTKRPSARLLTQGACKRTPSHAVNHGRRYRYYIERPLVTADGAKLKSTRHRFEGNGFEAKGWRLPAHQIEQLILQQLAAFLRARRALLDACRLKRKSPEDVAALFARASRLAEACESGSIASQIELVAALVRRITVAQSQITLEIDRRALAKRLLDQEMPFSAAKNRRSIVIEVPVKFRRRGVEAKLVVLDQQQRASEPDANLVKVLVRAHGWFGRTLRGEASGVGDIARVERLDRTYVTRVICLAFLAPEITKSMLEGRQPIEFTAKRLISSGLKIPLLWDDQVQFVSAGR